VSRCVREWLAAGSRAVVVGVHSRACHLRLPGGRLMVLVAADVPLSPNGVAADVGAAAWRRGQTVALGADDLDAAEIWEPRPRVGRLAPSELADRLRAPRAMALAAGAGGSLLPLLWASWDVWGIAVPARRLCAAAIRGTPAAVAAAAHRLAGLGPGLTPSGDDFLSGFAAAWVLVGESVGLSGAARARVTTALCRGARAGASPLGWAWLAHSVRGELPEPMTRFAGELFSPEPRDLGRSLRGVLAVGASSGTDWTVGFLLGAAAVLESRSW
jgi:hypothetical protein